MTKWEYRTVNVVANGDPTQINTAFIESGSPTMTLDHVLTEQGEYGWEVVGVIPRNNERGVVIGATIIMKHELVE